MAASIDRDLSPYGYDRHSEADINFAKTGDELIKAYYEMGYRPPQVDEVLAALAQEVGRGSYDFLLATVGGLAVGSIIVKINGPEDDKRKIFETALRETYPGQWPISVFYELFVKQEVRFRRIAVDLVNAAEQSVADRIDAAPRSAICVECHDVDDFPIILRSGYEFVKYRKSAGVVLERLATNKASYSTEPVFLLSKDLSHLRKTDVE